MSIKLNLDGEVLMRLRDVRIEKDEKKKKSSRIVKGKTGGKSTGLRVRKGQPPPKIKIKRKPQPPPTANIPILATLQRRGPRANIITIAAPPDVLVIDSEDVSTDDSWPEEDLSNSDSEWPSAIASAPLTSSTHLSTLSQSSQLFPLPALHMNLRPRKSTTTY